MLRAAVAHATAGSDAWRTGHIWLGQAGQDSADPAGALEHFTAVRNAVGGRSPTVLARCLAGRSVALLTMGRVAEAADARHSLAVARGHGYPVAEALALAVLSLSAGAAGDWGQRRPAGPAGGADAQAGRPGPMARYAARS